MTRLIKSQKVLDYLGPTADVHYFGTPDEDSGNVMLGYKLTQRDFDDFGRPEKLTITIEPGDKLN
jgi:hypothetical protein